MRNAICRAKGGLTLLLLVVGVGFACGRGPGDSNVTALRRSATTSWAIKRSTASGLQVEVPTDLCAFRDIPSYGVAIKMHTLPPPRGVLADKKCLLEMQIKRKKREDFESDGSSGRGSASLNVRTGTFEEWVLQFHDSISRDDSDQFMEYRYDLRCPNGDVLWTETAVTKVYEGGVSLYDKEDDAIVRRILGSLRCIDSPRGQ